MMKKTSKRGLGEEGEAAAKATPLLSDEIGQSNSGASSNRSSRKLLTEGGTSSSRSILSAEIEKPSNNSKNNGKLSSAKSVMSAITVDLDAMDKNDNEIRERKQGHKFFFFCCDSKRAVLILNLTVLILNLFTFTAGILQADPSADGYVKAVIIRSCGMFVTFTTVLGAFWYSKSVVTVGLAFTFYQFTMSIIGMARYNWNGSKYNEEDKLPVLLPFIWYSMKFYAEAVFISEVHEGIMSHETYKRRERYSCCCTKC